MLQKKKNNNLFSIPQKKICQKQKSNKITVSLCMQYFRNVPAIMKASNTKNELFTEELRTVMLFDFLNRKYIE